MAVPAAKIASERKYNTSNSVGKIQDRKRLYTADQHAAGAYFFVNEELAATHSSKCLRE